MRHITAITLLTLVLAATPGLFAGADTVPGTWRVYIGTYTGGDSEGIYTFTLDAETGAPGEVALAAETENPSFLALHPALPVLYAAGRAAEGGIVSAFRIDRADGTLRFLNKASSEGAGPCHVAVAPSGQHVAVANYSGGSMALLPVDDEGRLAAASEVVQYSGQGPHPTRQRAPHAHAVDFGPEGRLLHCTDLGTDRVHIHRYNAEDGSLPSAELPPVALAPGAGPRHLAFHPTGRFAYVVNELDNTVTAFARDADGWLEPLHSVTTLPEDFLEENTTAEIVVHPNGRFVYASNRGHDSIAAFAIDPETGGLAPLGQTPTGGERPRNFNIDPAGRFLLAANQDTGDVNIFRVDPESGALTPTGGTVSIPQPVCVVFRPAS